MQLQSRLNRLAVAASVATLTVGLASVAPAQKASAQLVGSGATSIETLVPNWFAPRPGVSSVTYNLTGSGTGRTQFQNGVTDFVSTDITLPRVDGQVIIAPITIPVAFTYNVPGFAASLSTQQACGIISGTITNWSQVGGPDLPITFVYRSDSSGTTTILNSFVSNFCGISVPPFPVGVGAQGGGGVVSAVQSTPGAVGYVDAPAAVQAGLPVATLDRAIVGPNYIVFRGTYSTPEQAAAARSLCQYLTGPQAGSVAASLGYGLLATDPAACNAIAP